MDVNTGTYAEDQEILIEDDRIIKIGKAIDVKDEPKVIDLQGNFVIPGLCDAHVHVNAISANLNNLDVLPPTYVTPQAMKLMEAMLNRGFTTIRDAAGADWGIAKAINEGFIKAPRLLFGGPALSPTGGHGDSRSPGDYSKPKEHGSKLSVLCDGITEVRKAARDIIRSGGNHIKIMASGGVASPTDRIDSLQFSSEEITAIVEEANQANIYVLAHAYTAEAINRALRLGVRSIEHGNLLNEESIQLFKENDAFLVPTLITYYALKEEGLQLGLSKDSYAKVDTVLENGKNAIKQAYEGGVMMVYGTDLLGEMQRRQLEEFTLLAELMSNADILKTATINAAKLFQMGDEIGDIKPGYKADILVYSQNPLDDILVLTVPEESLKLILKDGQIIKNIL